MNRSTLEQAPKALAKCEGFVLCCKHQSNNLNTMSFGNRVRIQLFVWNAHTFDSLEGGFGIFSPHALYLQTDEKLKKKTLENFPTIKWYQPLLSVASTFWQSKGGSAPVISVLKVIWVKFIIPGPTFFRISRVQFWIKIKIYYSTCEPTECIQFYWLNITLGSSFFRSLHTSSSHI